MSIGAALAIWLSFVLVPQSGRFPYPGTWQGSIAWEHGTRTYPVRLTLGPKKFFAEYPSLKCKIELTFDGITPDGAARLREGQAPAKKRCSPFGEGTFDLVKVSYFPEGAIHSQYYPKGGGQLWLADLERVRR